MKHGKMILGELHADIPVIQGGMGVGISLSGLAGAVAAAGGIGIISTAQIGFREPDFDRDPIACNLRTIGKEIEKARQIARGGIVGVNIMVATQRYEDYVRAAVLAGTDCIISGAGLPLDLPGIVAETEDRMTGRSHRTMLAPIVSSTRALSVVTKYWMKKYGRKPDFIVAEGPLAGGHLGFSKEQLTQYGADSADVEKTYDQAAYDEEVKAIMKVVKGYEEKYDTHIPVVTAGGIYTHEDVKHQFELGAEGVQVATRFVTTEECDAPDVYKQAYIQASKEDIVITQSPVGMPGRAILNPFLKKIKEGERPAIRACFQCLEHCDIKTIPYCITNALVNAAEGAEDTALLFCGSNAFRSERIENRRRRYECTADRIEWYEKGVGKRIRLFLFDPPPLTCFRLQVR